MPHTVEKLIIKHIYSISTLSTIIWCFSNKSSTIQKVYSKKILPNQLIGGC